MKKRPSSLPVLAVLFAGAAFWAWQHYHHAEKLGAGKPLDQSHSQIAVLSPTDEPTPLPTDTSSSAIIGAPGASPEQAASAPIILTSATIILTPTVPAPQAGVSTAALNNLQLGVLLSLAAQQYASGGAAALVTLKSAEQLADSGMKQKIAALRQATPANGPITAALLLVEAQRVRQLGAPGGNEDTSKPASASWLGRLIQVHMVAPKPALTWSSALNAALLQLAANNPAGSAAQLAQAPLKADKRLDDLRTALADYVEQNDALAKLLSAYATGVTP